MPELLRLPEVAAGATTATLCDWLVRENQQYAASDVLATIETDKAVVDFTADSGGVLLRVLVPAGTEAQVGAPIALIARAGETVEDVDAVLAALTVKGGPVVAPPGSPATVPDRPNASPPPETLEPSAGTERSVVASGQEQDDRIFTSPLARRLAHDAGIAIESITGTGPNGRIVRRDVEMAIAGQRGGGSQKPSATPQSTGQVAPPDPMSPPAVILETPDWNAAESLDAGEIADVPHSRVRRAIALRLTESKQTIPHFYLRGSAQVDELLELRARLNETSPAKISINDFVIKAAACAHQAVPAMNVIWTADCVRKMATVDLGTAVATTIGLVTPVLHSVERMPISVVAATTRDFVERARQGRLYQHELEGGSSTVTNLGMYGTEEFAAIINPPQSSILAVGAVRMEPVVTKKGKVRPRALIRVTVSVDHRPIDGATAAQWMCAFLEALEQPIRLLV
jgi:pyruvate dehydrogenase E2 component (dihydrolipoamide acetyltransferase)